MPPAGNNKEKTGKEVLQQSKKHLFLNSQLKDSWVFMLVSSLYLRTMLDENKVSKIRHTQNRLLQKRVGVLVLICLTHTNQPQRPKSKLCKK